MFEHSTESRHNNFQNNNAFGDWQEILGSQARSLGAVAVASEREFLALGGRFQGLWGQARGVTTQSDQMVRVVSGEKITATMTTINNIVSRLGLYLSNLQREMDEISGDFREIISMLENAKAPLVGFGKINKVLRMLGISTKIESSRLGGNAAGFETLANDVARLSVDVVSKSETITGQLNSLEGLIGETLERVRGVEAHQHAQVHATLQRVRESLETLETVNSQRGEAAAVISAISAEMEQNLGEIVTFMQFHDIVRQQLEHVQEAFDELSAAIDRMDDLSQQARHNLAVEIGDICELQMAQLKNSDNELEHAIGTITKSLESISTKGGGLAGEVRKMAGVSDQTDQTFFSTMEKELAGVTTVLAESARENGRLISAMGTVIGTIGEIITFVRDIETIGTEIELIALNAQIKAVRVGSEGAALGVLAEAIQRLSLDTMEQTASVSRPLQAITAVTERLQGRVANDSASIDRDVKGMLDELTISLQEICAVQNEVFELVASIDGTVDSLQGEIVEGIRGIAAHEELSQAIADSLQAAEQVCTASRREFPPPVGQPAAERLKVLAARYTMHSERKVHEVVTRTERGAAAFDKAVPFGGSPAGDQAASADSLGDNVELF
ncbi:methyl-accepting chemotaxis protein [Geobacter argillaceus]|uniref:Methyl-accepting transducer domain-containing protein n=1 Tax=Geobacter argillaceus TaxID=345631 RepID=A0A562W847_9BACT|nr:methyl-accepting chemotaxis protein [Geobacter argillaceus]TWJ26459.1 hypothetical protein JN12_01165 [Geobacter argillaceus]